ncbi:MAG: MBL fold metallo-hydrolase [Acidobacteria bacterium]|nr:MBL fold metallo-hydrolase [Acidobacteriota bacterium]
MKTSRQACWLRATGLLVVVLITSIPSWAQQTSNSVTTNSAPFDDGQLHVVLCGTGSPLPDANRAQACTAILAGSEFVLVDAGSGSWRKVATNNLPVQNLSAILLTHYHSDHIGDLGEALMQSWVAGRSQKLNVYGPPGVEQVVAGFAQAYSLDTDYRVLHHGQQIMPRAAAGAIATPVKLKSDTDGTLVFDRNGLKVTAFKVNHDPVSPAYGYRFEYKGRVVVVSGDTAKSDNLAKHAAGADLLIHEVIVKNLIQFAANNFQQSGNLRRAKLSRDINTYHTSPLEAAEVAATAKAETLVFTHIVPPPNSPQIEQALTRGVSDVFKGKVVIGSDGMRFDLPPRN